MAEAPAAVPRADDEDVEYTVLFPLQKLLREADAFTPVDDILTNIVLGVCSC